MDDSHTAQHDPPLDDNFANDILEEQQEYYDTKLPPHGKDVLRIGFLNVNGIPTLNHHPKNDALFQAISEC